MSGEFIEIFLFLLILSCAARSWVYCARGGARLADEERGAAKRRGCGRGRRNKKV